MTIQPIKQQNYGGYAPLLVICLMVATLLTAQSMIRGIDQTNEAGISGDHANHEDTISTVMSGNCKCGYPGCSDCGGTIAITLEPTVYITPIETIVNPATPDIPDPVNNVTTFPTLVVDPISTHPATMIAPTLIRTVVPGPIPVGTPVIFGPLS